MPLFAGLSPIVPRHASVSTVAVLALTFAFLPAGVPRAVTAAQEGYLAAAAAISPPLPDAVDRVSVTSDGQEANGGCCGTFQVALSADGSVVAFSSSAENLVPSDTNYFPDVFVRDRTRRVTERVSISSDGQQADGQSGGNLAISHDGRYIAFDSSASNLVVGDTNGTMDAFVHDRRTGITERVSVPWEEGQSVDRGVEGQGLDLSADGRYVTYIDPAPHPWVRGGDTLSQVVVRDRLLGLTDLVSVTPTGLPGDGESWYPSLSSGGRCNGGGW